MDASQYTLHRGDCLQVMATLPAESVDAVIVDPPYYNVVKHAWDNQWPTRAAYVDWIVALAAEWKRLLKPNGSLFMFCDEMTEAYIQVRLDDQLLLLNKMVWFKSNNLPVKNAHMLRTFAPMTERALFYTKQYDPLRAYFEKMQGALGLSIKQINARLGHRKAEHAFYWNSTQWDLPTPETYAELCALIPADSEFVRREYEALRRHFNADPQTWDVLQYPIQSAKESALHPTAKPLRLMERIVTVITNQSDTVLDCCMGSGTTGVACMRAGRNFIGIESDEKYFSIAEQRIAAAAQQLRMF